LNIVLSVLLLLNIVLSVLLLLNIVHVHLLINLLASSNCSYIVEGNFCD
jgi:hypothetical protein